LFFPTAVFLYKLHVPWKTNWNFCLVLGTPVFIHLVNQAETCFSVTYKNKAFHFWPLTFALAIQLCRPVIHKIQIFNLSWISKSTKISNIPIYLTLMEPNLNSPTTLLKVLNSKYYFCQFILKTINFISAQYLKICV
jgi:hypothetical protein